MNKPTDDTNAQNNGTYELRMRLTLGAVQGERTIKSDAIAIAHLIQAAVGRRVEPVAATRGVSSNFALFDRHGTTDLAVAKVVARVATHVRRDARVLMLAERIDCQRRPKSDPPSGRIVGLNLIHLGLLLLRL